jgi:hypothetical protein
MFIFVICGLWNQRSICFNGQSMEGTQDVVETKSKRKRENIETISIIGSAGRNDDKRKMSKTRYEKMVVKAEEIIFKEWDLKRDQILLVSGGAALADHVVVDLFLKYHDQGLKLRLELPCAWDAKRKRFKDDGTRNWRTNPGGTCNCKLSFCVLNRVLTTMNSLPQ